MDIRIVIIGAVLILASCTSQEEMDRRVAAIREADHRACMSYGFVPGTEAYGFCRMKRTELRLQILNSEPSTQHCQMFGSSMTCF